MSALMRPNQVGEQILPANEQRFTPDEVRTLLGGEYRLIQMDFGLQAAILVHPREQARNTTATAFLEEGSAYSIYGPALLFKKGEEPV